MRLLAFARSRLFSDNPNYRHGYWSKIRAALEAHVMAWQRALPALIQRLGPVLSHPVVKAMVQELAAATPEEWARPRGRGLIHLPWRQVAAARAWVGRCRRLKAIGCGLLARSRGAQTLRALVRKAAGGSNAHGDAHAKTKRDLEQEKQAQIEALRRWSEAHGIAWSP